MTVDVPQNQAPANRAQRKCGRGERDRRQEEERIGVARVVPDLPEVDAMEHPGEQRDTDGEPNEPGSSPTTAATRGRWRGQPGPTLHRGSRERARRSRAVRLRG